MANENVSKAGTGLVLVLLFGLLLFGISLASVNVSGINVTNGTGTMRTFVWNTEPNLTNVVLEPQTVDLVAGNVTTVNCTGWVWDYNSWQDISNVSATLYLTSEGDGNESDNNIRYINNSCQSCTDADGTGTNATCSCLFSVWYYAYNGTWTCNMTVLDNGGNATERFHYFNTSQTSNEINVSTVLGIEVPPEVDYGNLSVSETSNMIPVNISNWGNVPINVSVRGWGSTEDYEERFNDTAMICAFGNISNTQQRYSIDNSTAFNDMFNVTNASVGINDFWLPVRTNDTTYGNDTNQTYFALEVPLTVGGTCNGTLQFSATQTVFGG